MPEALALNVTVEPMIFVWLCGWNAIDGGTHTVSVAIELVIEPAPLLATTVYEPASEG